MLLTNVNKLNAPNYAISITIILMKIKSASIVATSCIMKFTNTTFAVIKHINAKTNVNKRAYVKLAPIQKSLKSGLPKMDLNFLIKFTSRTLKLFNVNRRWNNSKLFMMELTIAMNIISVTKDVLNVVLFVPLK